MSKIEKIIGEEMLDSRGNPTLIVTVETSKSTGRFTVPSGASTGKHEAHELRDGDKSLFNGMGVHKAIKKIEDVILPELKGMDVTKQEEIDNKMIELDGTPNKEKLGGNTIIGVSIACASAAASWQEKEPFEYLRTLKKIEPSRKVPLLFMNLINGGKHASSKLAFQEYHVVPQTDSVEESLSIATSMQKRLKEMLIEESGPESANLGDEGGFAPNMSSVTRPLELLYEIIKKDNLENKVKLSMDVAASSFYKDGKYEVDEKKISKDELFGIYRTMIGEFPVFSVEDPFEEEDFENFAKFKSEFKDLHVVGDDLTVTNPKILKKAIDNESINAIIIKPNQVGTLTETLQTMKLARENNIECIVSHRSGETNDNFITDLAYAFGCFGLKAGAPQRGERVVKYNRLMHIASK
jgi:enolase